MKQNQTEPGRDSGLGCHVTLNSDLVAGGWVGVGVPVVPFLLGCRWFISTQTKSSPVPVHWFVWRTPTYRGNDDMFDGKIFTWRNDSSDGRTVMTYSDVITSESNAASVGIHSLFTQRWIFSSLTDKSPQIILVRHRNQNYYISFYF